MEARRISMEIPVAAAAVDSGVEAEEAPWPSSLLAEVEEVIPTEEMVDRTLRWTARPVFILVVRVVVPVSTPWFPAAMVETQAQPARSWEELSLPEMVEGVPETVKTVFRRSGVEELEYREMVGTELAPIYCLEVGAEAALHPRPASREDRA
jgi:hypothetical protein